MPKIKMLSTVSGADDGFTVREYVEGQEYEVSEALAATLTAAKQAELTDETTAVRGSGRPRKG